MQKYAVLSDIHGNSWALDAVLHDIAERGIKHIINLGDIFYGPLNPEDTARLLESCSLITVQGNQDRFIYEEYGKHTENVTLRHVLNQLSEAHIEWLRRLPKTHSIDDELFLCHGTPDNDETYLIEDISQGIPQIRSDSEIQSLLRNIPQSVILCGHSHLQGTVRTADGTLIVNPGSVGLPAYTDEFPVFHKMESGSPHASYAIVSKDETAWKFEHVKISYNWEKAVAVASKNHRDDWARWLLTGRDM